MKMKSLCIVPCGKKKIWDTDPSRGPTQALHVYSGPLVKKCIEYARKFHPHSWVILSAKFGFLFPSDVIPGDYNVSFNINRTNPITVYKLSYQAIDKNLTDYDNIVVLGGHNYVNICIQVFGIHKVKSPLSSCRGIGFMLSRIKKAIDNSQPFYE